MAAITNAPETDNPFADPHTDVQSLNQDVEMVSFEPARLGFKKYVLYYKIGWVDGTLHLGSSKTPPLYFFQSKMSLSSPQLFLRRCIPGEDEKSGPVVNFARIRTTSRHMVMGTGAYSKQADDAGQIAWEELTRDKNSLRRSDYHFNTSAGDNSELGNKKTSFCWRKNMDKKLSTVYECIKEDGIVVARLFSGGAFNWKKGGEFDVAEGLNKELEEYLIMSALAIWAMEALNYQSLLSGFSEGKDKKE